MKRKVVTDEDWIEHVLDENGHDIKHCPYCGCRLKPGSVSYDEGFCIESAYTAGACRGDDDY